MDHHSTPEPIGPVDRLRDAWFAHVSTTTNLFDRLAGRYREKHRRYHSLIHVDAVVADVTVLASSEMVNDLDAVIAAALYHDAIYEPASSANERASARLARRDLTRLGRADERVDAVSAMIEETKSHTVTPDVDTAVLFDADLAILGASPEDYAAYSKAVRSEYRHVDDEDWTPGRAGVLQSFLDRPSIYATESGRQRWESAAHTNLATELEGLSS